MSVIYAAAIDLDFFILST